jgi:cytochrome c oxidase subunit 2
MTVAPKNAYEIQVTAWQWGWNFRYPNGATSDDLVIPAATPVRLIMRSNDVIHSLFIPDFRVKKDVVPGRYSQMWFEAVNPTGNDPTKLVPAEGHHLFCTEYCGTGHSNMNRTVYVLPRPAFDEWLEKTSRWMDDIAMEDLWAIAGPRFFARCVQCHTTTGVDGNGPSWGPRAAAGLGSIWDRTSKGETKFVDGKTLADLVGPGKEYGTPEDYLRDSILNPGKHLVGGFGNAMPTFKGQLTDPALDALIGMMKNIDQFDAAGKPKPGTEAAKIVDEYNAKKSEKQ